MKNPLQHRFDYCPWFFRHQATEEERAEQLEWQEALRQTLGAVIGTDCYISPLAGVFTARLVLGDRSYIAAYAYVTDDIELGTDCTINPYAVVRGKVWAGRGVRIGAHTSIVGFNHGHSDTEKFIFEQPLTTRGIFLEDDLWIGSNTVIVDGIRIGAHSIIAGGSVVTKDVTPYSVMGGNPARLLKTRPFPAASTEPLEKKLTDFGHRVREELPAVLNHYLVSVGNAPTYLQQPGHRPTVRAWCDAIEIAAMFGSLPPGFSREELITRLQSYQNPVTGLIPDPWHPPAPDDNPALLQDHLSRYHLLAVGYALEVLGSKLLHPVHVIENLTPEALWNHLDSLPWKTDAWGCGDWIDGYGTGLYLNRRHFGSKLRWETIYGWLDSHVDQKTGLWGSRDENDRWLQPVNGFYRLTRGTYAQNGAPLPCPEKTIDSILEHSRDAAFFGPHLGHCCNVLDVIHPLWLCAKQTPYRKAEGEAWARIQMERVLTRWKSNEGFSFDLESDSEPSSQSSLQGTEMGLSILYLLADYLGISGALNYVPQGVHRTAVMDKA